MVEVAQRIFGAGLTGRDDAEFAVGFQHYRSHHVQTADAGAADCSSNTLLGDAFTTQCSSQDFAVLHQKGGFGGQHPAKRWYAPTDPGGNELQHSQQAKSQRPFHPGNTLVSTTVASVELADSARSCRQFLRIESCSADGALVS